MKYDATGIDVSGGYPTIKPGWYPFRIGTVKEGESKTGDPQYEVNIVCLDHRYKDMSVRHWVTVLDKSKPGAGIAVHFVKCIGEPWEGNIDVDHRHWENKLFMGKVDISEYGGKRRNKLVDIAPMPKDQGIAAPPAEPTQESIFEEEIRF